MLIGLILETNYSRNVAFKGELMEKFMNAPEPIKDNIEDIRNAYKEIQDIKAVARQYCLSVKKVREILK